MMFAATRLRFPHVTAAIPAAGVYQIQNFFFGSPAYDVTEPRFFLPRFYQLTTGANPSELVAPADFTVEGVSIKVGGVWYLVPNSAVVMDSSKGVGVLLEAIPGLTIPANSIIEGRVAFTAASGATMIGAARGNDLGETSVGATSSLAGKLTDGSALVQANSFARQYMPAFMVAKGGDGRPVVALIGDSIEAGANENSIAGFMSARGNMGYWQRGLDDNVSSKRIAFGTLSLEGARPSDWNTRANWSMKLDAVKMVTDANGGVPPFTHIGSNHGNNNNYTTQPDLYAVSKQFWALMNAEAGWGAIPIYHSELLPRPTSTDGFQTLGNQGGAVPDLYNGGVSPGQRWVFNEKVGKGALLGDPTAIARTEINPATGRPYLAGSFAPWRVTAGDTGNNRDKLNPVVYATTLTAAYAGAGATVLVVNDVTGLTVGQGIIVGQGIAGEFDAMVRTISGSAGSYNVTITAGGSTALAIGSRVTACQHSRDGLHPMTSGHIKYAAEAVIPWKVAQGWV